MHDFAIISWMSKSRKLVVLAGCIMMAVSAPLDEPPMTTTSWSTGMIPASAAIRVTSTVTLTPAQNNLKTEVSIVTTGRMVEIIWRIKLSVLRVSGIGQVVSVLCLLVILNPAPPVRASVPVTIFMPRFSSFFRFSSVNCCTPAL